MGDYFKARYVVEEAGYVRPARVHECITQDSYLRDGMTNEELEHLFNKTVQFGFNETVRPIGINFDEFAAWARRQLDGRK